MFDWTGCPAGLSDLYMEVSEVKISPFEWARLLRTDKIIGRHFVMKCSRFFYIKSDTFGLKVS